MDEWQFELAQATMDRAIESALQRVRSQRSIAAKGCCHNCDEPFEKFSGKLFCNSDCRDDFDKRNRRI